MTSLAGPAIGCSDETRCDIKWEVGLWNSTCPCAFNISCCTNGVTLSFWWYWNLSSIEYYRYFLDVGGIYVFYKPSGNHGMHCRIYVSSERQFFSVIPLPNGAWRHVTIVVHADDSIYRWEISYTQGVIVSGSSWFPGATRLTPQIQLTPATGNYSFEKRVFGTKSSLHCFFGDSTTKNLTETISIDIIVKTNGTNPMSL